MNQVQHELMHYGVLGMHWGKRKAQAQGWVKEAHKSGVTGLKHPILNAKANRASIKSSSTKDKLRRAFLYSNTKELKDVNARAAALIASKKIETKKMDSKNVALGKSIVKGMLVGTLVGVTVMSITKNERAGQIASNLAFADSVMVSRKKYYNKLASRK